MRKLYIRQVKSSNKREQDLRDAMIYHVVLVAKSQPLSMFGLSKGMFPINKFLLVMVQRIKMPKREMNWANIKSSRIKTSNLALFILVSS
jgi:hypothetical protein